MAARSRRTTELFGRPSTLTQFHRRRDHAALTVPLGRSVTGSPGAVEPDQDQQRSPHPDAEREANGDPLDRQGIAEADHGRRSIEGQAEGTCQNR